ncbi:MAG: OmpH family outer membrane protein [Planctomycetes bacterium]|nr:OmpH family outer membrane protein [Planctomycetota bacterium]
MTNVHRVVWSCLVTLACQTGLLAQSATAPQGTLVAVADIPKIFEASSQFASDRDAIQHQLKSVEEELAAVQKDLATRSQGLKDLNPDSPDYKRLEMELGRQAADLQVRVRQAKKDFLQREAGVYHDTYVKVLAAVERVATRHRIALVLRFDSREIDAADPQSVAQGVSRAVVFQRQLDITQLVVDELRSAATAAVERNNPRR